MKIPFSINFSFSDKQKQALFKIVVNIINKNACEFIYKKIDKLPVVPPP
jgi:hypothetical protein